MSKPILPYDSIEKHIYMIRDARVMLDHDLANLYGVPTKALIQAVKRNQKRFPSDFMYFLTDKELTILRSQIVTSSWGGRRYRPYAFTEQGVAMLSSVLNSGLAIQVNIQIMRTFVKMREVALSYAELHQKINEMEKKYDSQFQVVFKAIKLLLDKPGDSPPRRF